MDARAPAVPMAAQTIRLAEVDAAELTRLVPAALYLLGVNGPLQPDDIGHVDRFVWRFAVLESPGREAALLAFSAMPGLMTFTRKVNAERPFTVPTEARRQLIGPAMIGRPFVLLVDPEPAAWLAAASGQSAAERVIPEMDG